LLLASALFLFLVFQGASYGPERSFYTAGLAMSQSSSADSPGSQGEALSADLDAPPNPNAELPNVWLFQFHESDAKNWLHKVRLGQTQQWSASRFRKEMQNGDIAFLWMTKGEGGLHGWGTLVGKDDQDRTASITIEGWIDRPISRAQLLGENAFEPGNRFVRMAQGTNFRLSLEEARAFSRFFPNRTDLLKRTMEPRRIPHVRLPQSIDPNAFTSEALDLIRRAASFIVGPSGIGQVTSTRILLALSAGPPASATDDGRVSQAFLSAMTHDSHIASAIKTLETDYRKEGAFTTIKPSSIRLSANSVKILKDAKEVAAKIYGSNKTSVDAIAAALFAGKGRVQARIADYISLDRLLSGISSQFSVPADAALFAQALALVRRDVPPEPEDDRELIFASLGNDDPWSGALDDRLGVLSEAKAFARAAAAKSFDPPLAFGIFGNWGSGKSFFMRLVHNHVEDLKSGSAEEAVTGQFHHEIVQIRFNAWHYVDQNLWASLVDHIFTEIDLWTRPAAKAVSADPLLEKLVTARELTLEAGERLMRLRQEQSGAKRKLRDAEVKLEEARGNALEGAAVYRTALLAAFNENTKNVSETVREAAHALGMDELVDNSESFRAAAAELSSEAGKAHLLWRARSGLLLSPWILLALFMAVVVGPAVLTTLVSGIKGSQIPWLSALTGEINHAMLQTAAALSGVAFILRALAAKTRGAMSVVDKFRRNVEAEAEKNVSKESAKAQKAAGEVAVLAAETEEAKVKLAAISKQLTEAAHDFNAESGHSRLIKLIRERMGEQGYAKHLGLIATIRKDFAELSSIVASGKNGQDETLKKQAAEYQARLDKLIEEARRERLLEEEEIKALGATKQVQQGYAGKAFSRIVLYIDDLDRCPPDRVVQVLQAVHLLLTFPLFVIFVAVDARWVGRSLEQHYGTLLQDDEEGNADTRGSAASALDYLEKIFQVAYKVRALDARASATFLEGRAKSAPIPQPNTPPKSLFAESPVTLPDELNTPPSVDPNPPTRILEPELAGEKPPSSDEIVARAIEMSSEELKFMSRIAGCAGDTPRRALRFLNSYRVIKAGLNEDDLIDLSDRNGHRALMTQLALATSMPAVAKRFNAILEGDTAFDELKSMLGKARRDAGSGAAAIALKIFLTEESSKNASDLKVTDVAIRNAIAPLKHYGAVAMRYSFGR
jgi:hypothetical protein